MLGVRLTNYQQIHSDIQCAVQPNVYMFVYTFIGAHIVPLTSSTCNNIQSEKHTLSSVLVKFQ